MIGMISVGNWVLGKLARGPYVDALAGDLAEGVRGGRSAGWYWRQVAAAIGSAWVHGLRERRGRILFAAVWGLFWPVRGLMEHRILIWWLRGTIGLSLTARQWLTGSGWVLLDVTYLWVGLLVYLALDRERWRAVPLRWFVNGWAVCLGLSIAGKVTLTLGMMVLIRGMGAEGLASAPYFLWSTLVGEPMMAAASLFVAMAVMMPVRRTGVVAAG